MSAHHAALFSSKASDKIVNKQEVDSLQVRNQQHQLGSLFINCCLVIQKISTLHFPNALNIFAFRLRKKPSSQKFS